jgi:hypothetical protein
VTSDVLQYAVAEFAGASVDALDEAAAAAGDDGEDEALLAGLREDLAAAGGDGVEEVSGGGRLVIASLTRALRAGVRCWCAARCSCWWCWAGPRPTPRARPASIPPST